MDFWCPFWKEAFSNYKNANWCLMMIQNDVIVTLTILDLINKSGEW